MLLLMVRPAHARPHPIVSVGLPAGQRRDVNVETGGIARLLRHSATNVAQNHHPACKFVMHHTSALKHNHARAKTLLPTSNHQS